MRKRGDGERGQSMVEFAIVLPVLALFLLGIIDVSRIIYARLIISQAARDAARYASVGDTDSHIGQVIQSDTGALGTSVQWNITPSPTRNSGDTVTVTTTYVIQTIDPLVAAIIGSKVSVSSAVSMRVE